MKGKCAALLKELTGKEHIAFTDCGNTSIKLALKLMKFLNKKSCLLPDQGGWMTYRQFAEKLKFSITEIKTSYGIIGPVTVPEGSFLLMNSLPAYAYYQDMSDIKGFIINDVSGSIGSESAKKGDIAIGSFGRWKPVDLGNGGFIAANSPDHSNFFEEAYDKEIDYGLLHNKLVGLKLRLARLYKLNSQIKKDLAAFDIIHRDKKGINVIIRYKTDAEKQQIVDYCSENSYEFTLCPREIRVNEKAVCIEVKRL